MSTPPDDKPSIAQMLAAYREERWHESPYTVVEARLIALGVRSVYRVPGDGTWELTTFEEPSRDPSAGYPFEHWHGVGHTLEEACADLESELVAEPEELRRRRQHG